MVLLAALGRLQVQRPGDLDDLAVHGDDPGGRGDLGGGQGEQLALPQPCVGRGAGHQLTQVPAPPGGQGPAEPGHIMIGGDLGGVDEQGRFPGDGHLRAGRGPARGLPVHLLEPGAGQVPGRDPRGDHGRQAPAQPRALPRGGRGVDDALHVGQADVLAGNPADDRGGEPLAQPALGVGVLADHARPVGCRSADRYQAIRSAPGRSRPGASAASRSATLASLAASLSSATASHWRRRPPSYHTARHRSPARRAGYTVIPPSTSTTTRPSPRVTARPVPAAKAERPVRRGRAAVAAGQVTPARDGCGFFVGILARTGADCAMEVPLLLRFAQVRGLMGGFPGGGQGQGRTADLPLFRRSVVSDATG
jgi:hypothetical protein